MNAIRDEIELSFALNDARVKFENWMRELKKNRKRTYKYSDFRKLWQDYQNRMEGDFKYGNDAYNLFKDFWCFCERCEKRYGIRCSRMR